MLSRKVLVTGGFGYVGSRLTPLLLEKGYFTRVLDLNLYGDYGLEFLQKQPDFPAWKTRFEFIRGDIRDAQVLRKALQGIETVIHLAAISNDPTGEVDETLTRQVNFDALGMMLAISKAEGVNRFINASSSSVFGARKESDINESLEPEPLTAYSRYKMLSEWLVLSAASKDFCAVNIRPATICGFSPRQRLDLTVNKLTVDGFYKNLITVHGGSQRRPNVGMTDMINLYSSLVEAKAEKIQGRTFNFGFENLSVLQIAQLVQGQLGGADRTKISVTDTKDLRDYHISSKKILEDLDYAPVSSIAQEIGYLKAAFADGHCKDLEHPHFYNMRSMKLDRFAGSYSFLSRSSK